MRCLHNKFTQQGASSIRLVFVMALAIALLGTMPSAFQSSPALAQSQDCIPSFHRLLLNGQQVDSANTQLSEFVDATPVGDTQRTKRIDQVVQQEGFASIPLAPRLANGNRRAKLRSEGTIYQQYFYFFNFAESTVWRVRNRSSAAKTVTLRSKESYFDWWSFRWVERFSSFSKTVEVPAYSDGFVLSPIVSRFSSHVLFEGGQQLASKKASRRTYRDGRTIEIGDTSPLFEVLRQNGEVVLPLTDPASGISLEGVGIFSDEPQRSVWKITNGTTQAQELTLAANDSDFAQTVSVPANSVAYLVSDEDGCLDNVSEVAEALWVAESEGLLKVLTESGDIAFELAIPETINALSVSPIDRTIWVLTNDERLEGFDANGQSIADNSFTFATPIERMVVGRNHAWLVSNNTLQIAQRNDPSQDLVNVDFPEPIQDLIYDSLRDQVWVVLANSAVSFDSSGAQQSEISTQTASIEAAAYDKRLDNIWLVVNDATNNTIRRYKNNGELALEFDAGSTTSWSKASPDSNGGLWLANDLEISHVNQRAEVEFTLPAFSDSVDGTVIVDIAAGSKDGSLWAASQTTLRQYDLAGTLLKTLTPDLGDGIIRNLNHIDLETELPATLPSITITSPEDGANLVETPSIGLSISPSIDTADLLSIVFTDNGSPIASSCEQTTAPELNCSIDALSEGEHQVSVIVNAIDGTASEAALVSFNIDSIAPVISIDSPIDGITVSEPQITISGSISEPSIVTVRDVEVVLDSSNRFSTEITLEEGFNNIFVSAVDAAGNDEIRAVMIIYNANLPPEITSQAVVTAKAENNYFYNVEASDPNNDELLYSLGSAPAGMTIDSATGEINWLPVLEGQENVVVSVTDQRGGVDQQSFTIVVAPANLPPLISSTPGTQTAVDSNYVYNVVATDPDGDTLRYRLLDAPTGLRIDSESGQITWQPYNAGTSRVLLEVSDPRGLTATQEYQIVVSFTDGRQPPVLAPIGDIVAPLGQTTKRLIQANDPEGQPIIYRISPLPLPEGMSFHERTGEFEYRPIEADVGARTFTFSALDGRFAGTESIQVTVPAPTGVTSLRGRTVLPDGTPLPGIRFEMEGQESISDANGDFLINNIPGESGRKRFIVDGSGADPSLGTFATIPEQFNIVAGTENHLFAPVYLEPLDTASADPVDPFQETTITSADVIIDGVNYGPITMTIDPRTANVEANGGELYDDLITISRIPDVEFGPAPMPDDLDLSVYISVQPFGVNYTTPARVSFPNVESFPPGTVVDIFGLNHDTGAFEKTGEAEVSADGRTVDSIGGAVFNNSWHGFVPRPPAPEPENDDCDCEGDKPANSSFGAKTGNFKDYYETPSYYSVGQSRNVRLVYNSKWASPNPILNFDTSAGLPPPVSMSQSLTIAGIETPETFLRPDSFGSIIGGAVAKNAVMFDASQFTSGVYPYSFTISCQFPTSRRAGSADGQTVIINESNSPYGAGWTVSDLRRLHVSADRQFVAMDLANGNFWRFTRNTDGTYEAPAAHFSELFENADSTFRLVTKSGTQYNFDLQGLLTSVSDRNNNETSYTYDNQQRLTIITDPVGLQTRFTYLGEKLQRITDPSGRFVEFEHDSEGNLVKIKDPDNTEINYEYQTDTHLRTQKVGKRGFKSTVSYDQFGRYQSVVLPDGSTRAGRNQDTQSLPDLRENSGTEDDLAPPPPNTDDIQSGYTDANGNAKSYQYDNDGFLMNTTDAVGRTTEIERDADKNPMVTTRPNGSIVRYTYDERGNMLTSLEEFNGALTTYSYDEFSLVTSVVDALNRRTEMTRDLRGNLIRTENAEGHISSMQYNARGQVTRMEDPNGLVTEYEYDLNFLLTRKRETPPTGNVRNTVVQYNEIGLPIHVATPDGIIQVFEYDLLNRVIRTQNQLGEAQTTKYDENGNITESRALNIDGTIATQETLEYDERDRLISTSRPHLDGDFSVTRQEYDNNSNVVRITDPDGKISRYFYDGENRTIQMIQPDGGIVSYEYDSRNQLSKVIAANGAITSYEYDVLARKVAEISPDRGRWEWEYNIVDILTQQTDERGISTTYLYDLIDRPISKTFPTVSEGVTYSYDNCAAGIGRLCAKTDEGGEYTYSYDFFGNLLELTRLELGVTYTKGYVYNQGDQLVQSTYPTGRVVTFSRDGVQRINGISSEGVSIVNKINYRGDSNMVNRQWQNGITEDRSYDQQGRLTEISLGSLGVRNYRYDASSNILSINSPFHLGVYRYDQNDRLRNEEINSNVTNDFAYDFNGNRLRKIVNGGQSSEVYRYEKNSNKLLNVDSVIANGMSIVANDNREFIHNDADRIRSIVVDGKVVGRYFYNDLGLRSRKEVFDADGDVNITIYHYNKYGGLIAETSAAGLVQKEYIWHGREPLAQIDFGNISYLHSDHLYTPRIGTNQFQDIVWQWESDGFGYGAPQIAMVEINLRLPGQYVDQESGLYYNWNRYYDPGLGRYVTSDPIGLDGGNNTYAYGFLDPIGSFDLDGLESIRDREKERGQDRIDRGRARDAERRQKDKTAEKAAVSNPKAARGRAGDIGGLVFDGLCKMAKQTGGSLNRALAKKNAFLSEVKDCSKPCYEISRGVQRIGDGMCPGAWYFFAGSCARNSRGKVVGVGGSTVDLPRTSRDRFSWGKVNPRGQCCSDG